MKYNVAGRIDFSGLHHYFEEAVAEEEADAFFSRILPDIVRSCLDLPALVTQPIPLLKKRDTRAITLSQKQVILDFRPDKKRPGKRLTSSASPMMLLYLVDVLSVVLLTQILCTLYHWALASIVVLME